VGKPLPGLHTKLDNIDEHGEGEVCLGGRHIFMGYLNAPEKTAEAKDADGWLHSGDLGKIDSDGVLHITGKHPSLSVIMLIFIIIINYLALLRINVKNN
jgi:long-chain-fatty-acid--CoA ligase ACSBG